MGGLRPRLHVIAFATLLLQIAAPAFASAALCCKDPAVLAGKTDELMECCKKGGAHICPMKKPARAEQPKPHDVTMRSCCTPDASIFVALLGTSAVLAPVPSALAPPIDVVQEPLYRARVPVWIAVADSPPPKA